MWSVVRLQVLLLPLFGIFLTTPAIESMEIIRTKATTTTEHSGAGELNIDFSMSAEDILPENSEVKFNIKLFYFKTLQQVFLSLVVEC